MVLSFSLKVPMAARTKKIKLDDRWREKIGISQIINRLQNHLNGKIDLSPTQIQAATILLKKVAPDLTQSELNANIKGQMTIQVVKFGDMKNE